MKAGCLSIPAWASFRNNGPQSSACASFMCIYGSQQSHFFPTPPPRPPQVSSSTITPHSPNNKRRDRIFFFPEQCVSFSGVNGQHLRVLQFLLRQVMYHLYKYGKGMALSVLSGRKGLHNTIQHIPIYMHIQMVLALAAIKRCKLIISSEH